MVRNAGVGVGGPWDSVTKVNNPALCNVTKIRDI